MRNGDKANHGILNHLALIVPLLVFGCVKEAPPCRCSEPASAATVPVALVKQMPSQGGEVAMEGVAAWFPPDALAAPAEVTVARSDVAPPEEFRSCSPVYIFGPSMSFDQPVLVTLPFREGEVSRPGIYWSDGNGEYDFIGGVVRNGTVTARVTHFSAGFVAAAPGTPPATWTREGGLVLRGTVVTMSAEGAILQEGRVFTQDGTIVAVAEGIEPWPEGVDTSNAIIIDTGGYIYPGLLNIHDHTAYNTLRLWEVPKAYSNRYQWGSHKTYKSDISGPKNLLDRSKYFGLAVESLKYAEIRALSGGTTAIQGTPDRKGVKDALIRNVELKNFSEDKVRQHVMSLDTVDAQSLLSQAQAGQLDAWFVHLAESRRDDPKSAEEFARLKQLGLLQPWTVAIHATGLQKADFEQMGQVGAKVVWSPLSNMLLYGQTTWVNEAMESGVQVSLGTDWAPSGSKTLLDEMKVAWEINQARAEQPGYEPFSLFQLAQMVTVNPASAVGWSEKVGTVEEGKHADLLVLSPPPVRAILPDIPPEDPYGALVRATQEDVQLVLVDGEPLWGDVELMQALKGTDMEVVCSPGGAFTKGVDATRAGIEKGDQRFAQLRDVLQRALSLDTAFVLAEFEAPQGQPWGTAEAVDNFLQATYPGIHPVPLEPLFSHDDRRFFRLLRDSTVAELPFDLTENYYGQIEPLLVLVNAAATTFEYLDITVGLNASAAREIIAHRDGPDGQPGSPDDDLFDSVVELDAVKYVGPVTLQQLRTFAEASPAADASAYLAFLNAGTTTLEVLDDEVGLRADAARNLVAHRDGPDATFGTADDDLFGDDAEILSVRRVGQAALETLRRYVAPREQDLAPVGTSFCQGL